MVCAPGAVEEEVSDARATFSALERLGGSERPHTVEFFRQGEQDCFGLQR